jgi:hypothetical protein
MVCLEHIERKLAILGAGVIHLRFLWMDMSRGIVLHIHGVEILVPGECLSQSLSRAVKILPEPVGIRYIDLRNQDLLGFVIFSYSVPTDRMPKGKYVSSYKMRTTNL